MIGSVNNADSAMSNKTLPWSRSSDIQPLEPMAGNRIRLFSLLQGFLPHRSWSTRDRNTTGTHSNENCNPLQLTAL